MINYVSGKKIKKEFKLPRKFTKNNVKKLKVLL